MLKLTKTLSAPVAAALLAGCAFHQAPYVAHEPGLAPSETSVFSVITENAARNGALEITHVDGKPTSCVQAGCPVWVRVKPGTHAFGLRFNGDYKLAGAFIQWQTAVLSVEVPDMQARHVYLGRQVLSNDRVAVQLQDLGERPDHGLSLGLEGANRKYHPVTF